MADWGSTKALVSQQAMAIAPWCFVHTASMAQGYMVVSVSICSWGGLRPGGEQQHGAVGLLFSVQYCPGAGFGKLGMISCS